MAVVSLIRCADYHLDRVRRAVREAVDRIGGIESFVSPGETVLCKVSMLRGAPPERAISTHPAVAVAAAELVREAGAVPVIGDSCGGADYGLSAKALEVSGIGPAAREAGLETVLFETAGQERVEIPQGRYLRQIWVSRAVTSADRILNLPKLKTHIETLMTGGVKNMLGCLPGAGKLAVHRIAPSPGDLGHALLDIYSVLRPTLTIMDGVVAMEGNGPSRGRPKPIGALLASTDAVALDHVAARLIGCKPRRVPTIAPAAERGLGENRAERIEVRGASIDHLRPRRFKLPSNALMRAMPGPLLSWANQQLFTVRPEWNRKGCDQCGTCVESCPVQAMREDEGTIQIDRQCCIECFCCFELCPEQGIEVRKSLLAKILSG